MDVLLNISFLRSLCVFIFVATWSSTGASAKPNTSELPPTILVSIEPIALIVKDLVGESAHVQTLLSAGASPHHFQLKVSDRKNLLQADMLIWVGEDMERFLEKVADQRIANGQAVLELMAVKGLIWPGEPAQATLPHEGEQHGASHNGASHNGPSHHRHSQHASQDDHSSESTHHDHHGHNHAHGVDPHLWLNPANVQGVARAIAHELGLQFPPLKKTVLEGLAVFEQEIAAADEQSQTLFSGVQTAGSHKSKLSYYVFHDGVGHFAAANGLEQMGALTQVPDESISAKHLRELSLQAKGARCLIADWSEQSQASKYAHRLSLPLVVVDGLATQQAYPRFASYYIKFAERFSACFIMPQ